MGLENTFISCDHLPVGRTLNLQVVQTEEVRGNLTGRTVCWSNISDEDIESCKKQTCILLSKIPLLFKVLTCSIVKCKNGSDKIAIDDNL